ncbi:MAG: glycosyltransferase family 9 protein [Thermodesulfobacteriota bacterium]
MPAWSESAMRPDPADQAGEPAALAVLQLARLGDFLQTTPLLAALRARHPQARVLAVVAPAQAPLALGCGLADEVLLLDPAGLEDAAADPDPARARARLAGLCAPLWSRPARAVYNLNLSPLAAGVAAGWAGAARHGWRLGGDGRRLVGAPWAEFVMLMVADRRLTRLHLCDILASYAEPAGPPLARLAQRVDPAAAQAVARLLPAGRPRVALQLGANSDLRRWPVENFAALAQGLLAAGAAVVLVGSQRERVLGRRLMRALGPAGAEVGDLMGRTDLAGLAAALAACDLVVSGDTGSLHLATAVGVKTLALYMGPAAVHETGPYGAGHLVLQARDHCGPCQEHSPACAGAAPCRRLITPAAALQAALALLEGAGAEQAAAGLELPPAVEPLAGELDGFGQRYRPLRPRRLDARAALALALREAGRVLLRPAYAPPPAGVELAGEWLAPRPEDAAGLAGLAAAAQRLALAAASEDAAQAGGVAGLAPGLRPLAALAGPDAPPRLAAACRAAAGWLAAAAG